MTTISDRRRPEWDEKPARARMLQAQVTTAARGEFDQITMAAQHPALRDFLLHIVKDIRDACTEIEALRFERAMLIDERDALKRAL